MKKARNIISIIIINLLIIGIVLEVGFRLLAPGLGGQVGVAARWVTTGQPYPDAWEAPWQQSDRHYYALRPGITDEIQYGSPTVSFQLTTIELWENAGIGVRNAPVDYFVDAVVVGDSFGFCFTEKADCWVDQLAAQTGRGLVNLSQPVTGTTSHFRMLETFGKPMTPPLVIWQAFGNDFNDDYGLAVFNNEIDPVADDSVKDDANAEANSIGGWLRRNSVTVAVIETALTGTYLAVPDGEQIHAKPHIVTFGDDNQHTLQFGSRYEQQALDMSREENQIGLEYSRDALQDAKTLIDEWDGQLAIVMMPTREEVYQHLTAPILGDETIARLQSARETWHDLCNEFSIACYDPYDLFVERALSGEALYHVDDMHLNAHGNAILADGLAQWLSDNDLMTCNPAIIPDCDPDI
ncbi:MAG: hypothetical protein ACPG7F_02140 [Aggregatilineales bacterium]